VVFVDEDEGWRGREASGGPTVHPTALPSNDDGWPLEAVAWQVGQLLWSEWRFGGRFGPSESMIVDPAIRGSSTSTFGSNRRRIKHGEASWR
jgi:hypothetical protein